MQAITRTVSLSDLSGWLAGCPSYIFQSFSQLVGLFDASLYSYVGLLLKYSQFINVSLAMFFCRKVGNCEEELPKKPVGQLLVDCRPSVGRLSAVCRPTVGRLLAICRPTVDRQTANRFSPKYRLSVGRQSADK